MEIAFLFVLVCYAVKIAVVAFLIYLAFRLVRAQEQSALYLLEIAREIKKIPAKDLPKD